MSPQFTPLLLLVVSFFLSHTVYWYYCRIPVENISSVDRLFVMIWDTGVTILLHGLYTYYLSHLPRRLWRVWTKSVLVGSVFVAFECVVRWGCIAFGEPIFRIVAGMMTDVLFLFLPLVGIGVGAGWLIVAGKQK